MGEVKFNEILSVYKEIKEIRKQSTIWKKFTPQFITIYNSPSTTAAAATVSSTSSLSSRSYNEKRSTKESSHATSKLDQEEKDETPVSKVLPPPISNIYFHMRLVNVMSAIDAGSCCRSCKPNKELSSITKEEQQDMRNGCMVYQNDWDGLLHDAKMKLAAFHKFQRENV